MEAILDTRVPDLDLLEGSLSGALVRPDDEAYEVDRRVYQLAADVRPLAIVRAADAADVRRTVAFARDHGLELAVRSGGHSVVGYGTVEGGIVLTLADMRGLHIDPEARLAWAQPGLTAREYTEAAAAHGLATPFGDTGSVGIAGLTLGAGIGWLVRKHGLAIDALVAVEIVTADGRLLVASETEHPDLFWAVRGGGGNFGVVTRFQFRLYEVGTVLAGAIILPVTREVVGSLVPIASAAPRELSTITFVMSALPPLPVLAEEHVGKPGVAVMFVYAGDVEDGQRAVDPFRRVAEPLGEMVAPMPYPGIYQFTAEGEIPNPFAIRSLFSDELDDAMVDEIVERMVAAPSPETFTQIRILGGAMADVPADATAFAHRERTVMTAIIAHHGEDAETVADWTAEYFAALAPKGKGVYSNFLADEGEARIRDAYPAATYERLAGIKRRYDPDNLFHRNQNIRPA